MGGAVLAAAVAVPGYATIPLFGRKKILHTLTGMGGAVLAAAVAVPGYGDQNFRQGINKAFKKQN